MENMDVVPPTAPSLVFARETYTPYWATSGQTSSSFRGTADDEAGMRVDLCSFPKYNLIAPHRSLVMIFG